MNHPNLKNFILVYYFIHYLIILPSKNYSEFRFSYLTINFMYLVRLSSFRHLLNSTFCLNLSLVQY